MASNRRKRKSVLFTVEEYAGLDDQIKADFSGSVRDLLLGIDNKAPRLRRPPIQSDSQLLILLERCHVSLHRLAESASAGDMAGDPVLTRELLATLGVTNRVFLRLTGGRL